MVIVSKDAELFGILQVVTELLGTGPFEGQKLQLT